MSHAPTRFDIRHFRPYPVLFSASWVIAAYIDTSVDLSAAIRSMVIVPSGAAVLQLLLTLSLRKASLAAFLTAMCLLLVLRVWPALIIILLVAVWPSRIHGKRPAARLFSESVGRSLDTVAMISLSLTLLIGLHRGAFGPPTSPDVGTRGVSEVGLPDIYVLLLDGHARSDTLAERFGMDASGFTGDLERRGFDVSYESNSNYDETVLTLVSMFYASHIPDLVDEMPSTAREQFRLFSNLLDQETPITASLRAAGYEIDAVAPPLPQFGLRSADRYVDSGQLNSFELFLIQRSLVFNVLDWVAPTALGDGLRHRAESGLASLIQLAAEPSGPRFVLGHVMIPHPPFVFDGTGDPVAWLDCMPDCTIWETPVSTAEYVRLYHGQAQYTHARVLETIDGIRAAESSPSVIVVMSDHGSRAFRDDPGEGLRNFLAVAAPGYPGLLAPNASLIELLPRLVNTYIGADIPIPNARYFTSPPGGPWPLAELEGAP